MLRSTNRYGCNKGKFEEVPDKLEQQNWTGFAKGDANIWREFIDREIPRLYGLFVGRWPNRSLAEELLQKKIKEYRAEFANPYRAAQNLHIDDVIDPAETRPRLIKALEMAIGKIENRPQRKHGIMPL